MDDWVVDAGGRSWSIRAESAASAAKMAAKRILFHAARALFPMKLRVRGPHNITLEFRVRLDDHYIPQIED